LFIPAIPIPERGQPFLRSSLRSPVLGFLPCCARKYILLGLADMLFKIERKKFLFFFFRHEVEIGKKVNIVMHQNNDYT
jgi:hypothetical protein